MSPISNTPPRSAAQGAARLAARSAAALLLLLATVGPAAAADRWFHVHVQEGDTGSEVMVNLPLHLIERVIDMMPEEIDEEIRIELNESDFDLEELRSIWADLRESEDATYMTVKERDETIEVRKEGNFLIAETTESTEYGSQIFVRFPLEVVDALFSGPNGFDLAAAVRALGEYGDGDMVTVQDRDTTVRVWVDDSN